MVPSTMDRDMTGLRYIERLMNDVDAEAEEGEEKLAEEGDTEEAADLSRASREAMAAQRGWGGGGGAVSVSSPRDGCSSERRSREESCHRGVSTQLS